MKRSELFALQDIVADLKRVSVIPYYGDNEGYARSEGREEGRDEAVDALESFLRDVVVDVEDVLICSGGILPPHKLGSKFGPTLCSVCTKSKMEVYSA